MIEASETSHKKLAYGVFACLVVYVAARSWFAAAGRPLWYDELLTLTVSAQGTWTRIWAALARPLDGQPPLFYVIEQISSKVGGKPEIALRLPSIMAFPCTLVCVFVYVKKRSSEIVALLCAALLLMTALFQYFAAEARPYSMVVACLAFALVCYQRVPSPVWIVLLALSLALAQSLHYYAVLAMVPFGLAEAVLFLQTRRFRWTVWAALAFGALPLLAFWKLLSMNKVYYGAHFWAHVGILDQPRAYGDFFLTNSKFGGGIALLSLAGVAAAYFWTPGRASPHRNHTAEERVEVVLLVGFLLLPLIAYLITSLMHSGLSSRYVLPTIAGIAIAFGYALSHAKSGAVWLLAAFIFSVVGVYEISFWREARSNIRNMSLSPAAFDEFLEGAGSENLPLVMAQGMSLVPAFHYGAPRLTRRFVYLVPGPEAQNVERADTVDKGIEILQSYWPIRVSTVPEFASANRKFLLCVEERGEGTNWLVSALHRQGWSLQAVAFKGNWRLFLVTASENSSPQCTAAKQTQALPGAQNR